MGVCARSGGNILPATWLKHSRRIFFSQLFFDGTMPFDRILNSNPSGCDDPASLTPAKNKLLDTGWLLVNFYVNEI
jgi:hypothetical protein